jgi:hypothetical protein
VINTTLRMNLRRPALELLYGDGARRTGPSRMNAGEVVDVGKHNKPATRSCPGCDGTGTSTATHERCNVCRGTGRI